MFHVMVPKREKADKLVEVVKSERPEQAIVFCRTKLGCEQLFRKLRDGGMNVKALHGDMSQGQRDGVMLSFKAGRVAVLVATDVAARGLDIDSVTHVINYDVPTSPDVYVHRIGRTGRAGRQGRAITFVEPSQVDALEAIERHINDSVPVWAPGKVGVRFGGPAEGDAPEAKADEAAEAPKRPTRSRRKVVDSDPADAAEISADAEGTDDGQSEDAAPKRRTRRKPAAAAAVEAAEAAEETPVAAPPSGNGAAAAEDDEDGDDDRGPRRRRRRGRKPGLSRGEGPLTSVVVQVGPPMACPSPTSCARSPRPRRSTVRPSRTCACASGSRCCASRRRRSRPCSVASGDRRARARAHHAELTLARRPGARRYPSSHGHVRRDARYVRAVLPGLRSARAAGPAPVHELRRLGGGTPPSGASHAARRGRGGPRRSAGAPSSSPRRP